MMSCIDVRSPEELNARALPAFAWSRYAFEGWSSFGELGDAMATTTNSVATEISRSDFLNSHKLVEGQSTTTTMSIKPYDVSAVHGTCTAIEKQQHYDEHDGEAMPLYVCMNM